MNIDSQKIKVETRAENCYDFLSRPENYERLMPESIKKFELNDRGGFLFQLNGMPEISLKLDQKTPYTKVVWGSANEKFAFKLWAEITEISTEQTQVQWRFQGDFNAMISMMAKKPLGRFIETLSSNLQAKTF